MLVKNTLLVIHLHVSEVSDDPFKNWPSMNCNYFVFRKGGYCTCDLAVVDFKIYWWFPPIFRRFSFKKINAILSLQRNFDSGSSSILRVFDQAFIMGHDGRDGVDTWLQSFPRYLGNVLQNGTWYLVW